jgi:enoyl-CoA hydratase/carnithine racemase
VSAEGEVRFTHDGAIWTATLHKPDEENALSRVMLESLADGLADVARAPECAVLLLQGSGETFSRGRDRASYARQRGLGPLALRAEFELITRANELLVSAPCVTLAAVRGAAFGAACGLVARCDLAVAASDARFGFPEIRNGTPPTIVMAYVAKAFPRKAAFELIVTGREMDAAEARELGFVSRVVAPDAVAPETRALAETLAALDPLDVRTCKQFWRETQEMSYAAAARYGVNLLAAHLADRHSRGAAAGH